MKKIILLILIFLSYCAYSNTAKVIKKFWNNSIEHNSNYWKTPLGFIFC